MKSVKKPRNDIFDDLYEEFKLIRDDKRSFNRKYRIEESECFFRAINKIYRLYGYLSILYMIENHDEFPTCKIMNKEIIDLYENHIVRGRGRNIYDELKSLPDIDLCPFCNNRPVATLDHYLPKSNYTTYAIIPNNLVGCCEACNTVKGNQFSNKADEQLFHPYYDDFDAVRWLYATVKEGDAPSINFFVKINDSLYVDLEKRVIKNFEVFNLNKLYCILSAQELSGIVGQLKRINERNKIKRLLWDRYDSERQNDMNHWKTALYEALYKNDWYCSGGYMKFKRI
ncbi:HNH endonuclease [Marinobacterium maritimum]|uniref:HNH endonuclease n=1 Tax=Marinobacterium maritimum TaxID=500162 RepID=A0ABN1I2E3_9GAMM